MAPPTHGIVESALYVSDVARSIAFYETVLGLRVISDFADRGCAMSAWDGQVLLLFRKGASLGLHTPHDGDGELHIAFGVTVEELAEWESWLARNAIGIEERRTWPSGGRSVYFRDPDRHLLELVTRGAWSVY